MKRILKYHLSDPGTPRFISLPINHVVVLTGYQHERFCMWVEVDDEQDRTESYSFIVYPTGAPLADDVIHIGSFGTQDNLTIWHVFRNV